MPSEGVENLNSKVFFENKEKIYYLGYYDFGFGYFSLSIESISDDQGDIYSKEEHIKWEELFETNDFSRELNVNEQIHFDGHDYKVKSVSHSNDGTILYYIDKKVVIDKEGSKEQAEADLKARDKILHSRLLEKYNAKKAQKLLEKENTLVKKKKWYHFFSL